jgi:hypothetical protein
VRIILMHSNNKNAFFILVRIVSFYYYNFELLIARFKSGCSIVPCERECDLAYLCGTSIYLSPDCGLNSIPGVYLKDIQLMTRSWCAARACSNVAFLG